GLLRWDLPPGQPATRGQISLIVYGVVAPAPAPTPTVATCPAFGRLTLTSGGHYAYATFAWSASGGGGQIEAVLPSRESGGRTGSSPITGRSGKGIHYVLCAGGTVTVTFWLDLHDECGHAISASSTTGPIAPEPCP